MVLIFSMPRRLAAASKREKTVLSRSTNWLAVIRRDKAVKPTRSAKAILTSPWMSAMVVSPACIRPTISRGIIEWSRSSTRPRASARAMSVRNSRRDASSRPAELSAAMITAEPITMPLTISMSPWVRPSSASRARNQTNTVRLGAMMNGRRSGNSDVPPK